MSSYDGVIIGNGIASHVTLYYFSLKLLEIQTESKESLPKCLLIIESPLNSSCSLNSTCHAGTINARDGISPLGDMIKQSYIKLCDFIQEKKPEGVYPGQLYKSYDISDEVRPELSKVPLELPLVSNNIFYGHRAPHHFFDPELFLTWLRTQYLQILSKCNVDVTFLEAHINDIVKTDDPDHGYELISNDHTIKTKKVLLTTGAELYSKWTQDQWKFPKLTPREGDFLIYKDIDLGKESFSIMIVSTNVVYRHFSKELLIGGTTNMPDQYIDEPNHKELRFFHSEFKKFYPELPDYNLFEIKRGTRVRGPKRYPFSGEINDDLFAMIGLYKNGFTFPFLLAPSLVEKMIQKNFLK
jgi:hypothetical protein